MNYGVYAPNSGRVVNAQLKVLVADITLTSSGSFEQIPIPAGFDSLEIVASLRGTVSATSDQGYLYLNGDTTNANYAAQQISANSTTVGGSRSDTPFIGSFPASTSTAGDYGVMTIFMPFISQTGIRRQANIEPRERRDASTNVWRSIVYNWESTEPITNITIRTDNHATDLFAAGSRVQVFGLGTFAVALAR